MKYERLTEKDKDWFSFVEVTDSEIYKRLQELEDKIEQGTLVFREKPKKKYYAIVGYRNCYGKFGWHIHYVSIEYEKEHNRVALNIDGRLFVTAKDLLFTTKAEAEAKLKELKGE